MILQDVPLQHAPELEPEDYDRPKYRRDCEALASCPHCSKPVAMRVCIDGEDAIVTCPKCTQRVYYQQGDGGWSWGVSEQPGTHASEGLNHTRPCPFVSCKYHLSIDVVWMKSREKLVITFPGVPIEELADTCVLDLAGADHKSTEKQQPGTHQSLERVGEASNITRERVRQIEAVALGKLREVAE